MSHSDSLVPPHDRPFRLAAHAADRTPGASKESAAAELPRLRLRLNELQDLLYADRRLALLVILQGIDTAGKDGTIKSVFQEVGPLGCSVASFGVPTEEELAHDYLWRYHLATPGHGKVVIFNRSHYESVLVERVHGLAPAERLKQRYDEINHFEATLAAEGTVIMKFFLHISRDEQRERLQERVNNPRKRWKFREGDLDERKHWAGYEAAFEEMVSRCNTRVAPWHVVPADRKWYRDLAVTRALVERLEGLDLRYPAPAAGIEGRIVE